WDLNHAKQYRIRSGFVFDGDSEASSFLSSPPGSYMAKRHTNSTPKRAPEVRPFSIKFSGMFTEFKGLYLQRQVPGSALYTGFNCSFYLTQTDMNLLRGHAGKPSGDVAEPAGFAYRVLLLTMQEIGYKNNKALDPPFITQYPESCDITFNGQYVRRIYGGKGL